MMFGKNGNKLLEDTAGECTFYGQRQGIKSRMNKQGFGDRFKDELPSFYNKETTKYVKYLTK